MSQAYVTSSTGVQAGKECDICSLTFPDDDQLRLHKSCHTGQNHFLCSDCPETFQLSSQLDDHWKSMHIQSEVNEVPVETSTPGKRTMRRKKGEVTSTPVVVKSTPTLVKVAKVLQIRKPGEVASGNGIKPGQPVTGKMKPYVCDICGKGCAYLAHLKRHVLVHSAEMPYKCEKCEAKFKREDGLKRHCTNVHKGVKRSS